MTASPPVSIFSVIVPAHSLPLVMKALRQLGPEALVLYGWYQLGLRSWLKRPIRSEPLPAGLQLQPFLHFPERSAWSETLGREGRDRLLSEAEEISQGWVRLFGGDPVPLQLVPPGPLAHWTAYERGDQPWGAKDVKFIWEPARFGWAFTLVRAYHLTADDRWAETFWTLTNRFLSANPAGEGPNWASAQEVALRLIALVFAGQVLIAAPASSSARLERLVSAIAEHASRIPPTLAYARAQQNNHLLTEAAGLYTAAAALPAHPSAPAWKQMGWQWFNRGLQAQIALDGAYAQHSTNYHRLLLQAALWMDAVATAQGDAWPAESASRLAAAVRWLQALIDPVSGQAPNLGPNDGAYILPLDAGPFSDYRPTLAAAGEAFLKRRMLPPGPWDEMTQWLSPEKYAHAPAAKPADRPAGELPKTPHVFLGPQSWAYFRAVRFNSRPGHADQLHVDLWWRGLNVAQDAGTYLYNASPPWQNALARTAVHNTVTIEGQDQMRMAGRFLWLDWAQAQVLSYDPAGEMVAEHHGYTRLGAIHQRQLERQGDAWIVTDRLLPAGTPASQARGSVAARLHWLLPDWNWQVETDPGTAKMALRLESPFGWLAWEIEWALDSPSGREKFSPSIARAGKMIWGDVEANHNSGWSSPTYGQIVPALSLSVELEAPLPVTLISRFCPPQKAFESE